jgi:hypothetical protein
VLDRPYAWWAERFGERCGICGAEPKPGKKLHRDHDHRTGVARGLLCFSCNRGLPHYATLEWLDRARAYLARTS